MERLKANINKEIEENDIEIYQFPDCDSDEDEDFQDQDRTLKNSIPFAIVSATHVLEVRFTRFIYQFLAISNVHSKKDPE